MVSLSVRSDLIIPNAKFGNPRALHLVTWPQALVIFRCHWLWALHLVTPSVIFGWHWLLHFVTLSATFCDPEHYIWWPQALHLVTPSTTFSDPRALQFGDPERFNLVTLSATFGDPKRYIWVTLPWALSLVTLRATLVDSKRYIWVTPSAIQYSLLRLAFAWFSSSARESILFGAELSGRDWANWGHALQYWTVCSSYQLTQVGWGRGEGEGGEGVEEVRWRWNDLPSLLTAGCLNPILRPAHERGIRHIVATAESMRIDLLTLLYEVHVCEYAKLYVHEFGFRILSLQVLCIL